MIRYFSRVFILTIPFFTGCVAIDGINNVVANSKDKYKEPTSKDVANMRTFFGDDLQISIFPNSQKRADIKKDKDGGSVATKRYLSGLNSVDFEKKTLGMPFPPQKMIFSENKVPANQPFIVSMYYSSSELNGKYSLTTTCKKKYFLINLEPNKNYGADIDVSNKRCIYRIFEYLPDGREKSLTNAVLLR